MSRLIKTDTVGKDRTRLSKSIVLPVRELAKQKDVTDEAKDLAAFIFTPVIRAPTRACAQGFLRSLDRNTTPLRFFNRGAHLPLH